MTSNSIIWFLLDLKPSWQKKLLSQFEGNPCNISSQDVSKFTYLPLMNIFQNEKCIKATSYIVSINSLV